jgi:hypothetical protein
METFPVLTRWVLYGPLLLLFCTGLFLPLFNHIEAADDSDSIHWKQLPDAQVKIDDKTPLTWNVYQPEKKDKKDKKNANLVLVLIGHRYLMLDLKTRLVYEVPLSRLHAQDRDFESSDLTQETRTIPSSDWNSRDVGPAELVQVTLGDYGRVFQLQLPHPPDLRAFY